MDIQNRIFGFVIRCWSLNGKEKESEIYIVLETERN